MSVMRTVMTAALATALTALGLVHASATTLECTAESIVNNADGCIHGWLEVDVDADANVRVTQVNTMHRSAFEEYIQIVEGWEGSLEEYFAAAFGGPADPGTTYEHTIGPDEVSFTIEALLAHDTGDAPALGFWVDGDEVLATIDSWALVGIDSLTATFPGPVTDANGAISNNVVTWDAEVIGSVEALTATSLRAGVGKASVMPWVLLGGCVAFLVAGTVIIRRGSTTPRHR